MSVYKGGYLQKGYKPGWEYERTFRNDTFHSYENWVKKKQDDRLKTASKIRMYYSAFRYMIRSCKDRIWESPEILFDDGT